MIADKLSNGSSSIKLKVLMLAVMAAGLLVLQQPAQAQQTFDVECDVGAPSCFGLTAPFAGETFTCNPAVPSTIGTPSQCTRTLTGQPFGCVVTALIGAEIILGAIHTCTIPGPEAAAPAPAAAACPPATQEFSERRIRSGAASPSTGVSNAGNNANLSPSAQQAVNTGNVANEQGVVQSCSEADDIDFTGSSLEISPSTTSESTQTIDQAAAAN